MTTLSTLLQALMQRAKVGSQTLSNLTGLSRTSIDNWRDGSARHPKHWRPLLQIARVLALEITEVDALLVAAGYPPLATLAHGTPIGHQDRLHLRPWLEAEPDAPTVPALRHQLRAPIADFVGRADAIKTLLAALGCAPDGSAAAITGVRGMGGIGKTELAYLVANRLCETYPDAQIVVNMRGVSAAPLPATQALRQVIHTFMPAANLPDSLEALQRAYCAVLHGQRVLILADDACDAAQVRPLLPPPGCALLVTSRQRFSLPGMATLDLAELTEGEAITLLRRTCDRLSGAEAQTIARVCGSLPLALRAGGSLLHNLPALDVAYYLAQLADERQRLRRLRDPDDPQLDVFSSLALSYLQLDPAVQAVFRRLGVFVADFGAPLAQATLATVASEVVADLLHHLLRRNLLMYDVQRGRWRLHDLVRDLARHQLEAAGEWATTMWHYARAVVQQTQAMQAQYLKGGEVALAALAWFDTERPHIDASRSWATLHAGTPDGDRLLLEIVAATRTFGALRYDTRHERIPYEELARVTAQRLGDRRSEGAGLNQLGNAYKALGEIQRAIGYYEQSLAITRAMSDRQGERGVLNNLGNACKDQGEIRRAIVYYEQSLIIARMHGDQRSEGMVLGNLGGAYAALGETQRAITYYEQTLTIARAVGNHGSEGLILMSMGSAYAALGETRRAIVYYEQSLAITHALGDRRVEGLTLYNLGAAYADLGEIQPAIESGAQALTIARARGDRRQEGYALSTLAYAQARQGAIGCAMPLCAQALECFHTVGDRAGVAECQLQVGLALAQQGESEQALPLLHAAVAYQQEIGHVNAARHITLLARLEADAITNPEWTHSAAAGPTSHLCHAGAMLQMHTVKQPEILP